MKREQNDLLKFALSLASAALFCGPGAWAQTSGPTSDQTAQMNQSAQGTVNSQMGTENHNGANMPGVTRPQGENTYGAQAYNASKKSEKQVLRDLHQDNLTEIRAGQLAQMYSNDPQIKDFGQQLVKDHRAADSKVMSYAQNHNFNLGNDTALNQKVENSHFIKKLKSLRGTAFDQYFSQETKSAHAKAIQMVSMARNETRSQDFKNLLNDILPDLKTHHNMAAQLESKFMHGSQNQ